MSNRTVSFVVAALALAIVAGSAWADLAPGWVLWRPGSEHLNPPNSGEYTLGPTPDGTLLTEYVRQSVGVTPATTLDATVTTRVFRREDGGLTFEYTFSDFADEAPPLVRATLGGQWAGVAISDAGADASGSSAAPPDTWSTGDPYYLERGTEAQGFSPWIQWAAFSIGVSLSGDESSSRIWLVTDATDYGASTAHIIDTTVGGDVGILAPVPAPAAVLLGAIGLGLVGLLQRRRMAS